MLLGLKQEELDQWKASMHSYEKAKRTKRPFGKVQPPMEPNLKNKIQYKQLSFHPVLQNFRDQRQLSKTLEHEQISKVNEHIKFMKNNYKYSVDYDIINNYPSYSLPGRYKSISVSQDTRKKEYLDPTYNEFDIINGRNYEKGILQKRDLKTMKHYQRKIRPKNQNKYNIISGAYQDSESFSRVFSNNEKNNFFDIISGSYSNPEDEEHQKQKEKEREISLVKESQLKLPPSYRNRQPLILDRTTPLSPEIQALDLKNYKSKERYKQKYEIQEEYKMRNEYDRELQQEKAKNRVHNGRVLEAKAREFNILNAQGYHPKRSEYLFRKEADPLTYDLKHYGRGKSTQRKPLIKQSGFDTIQ